MFNIARKEIEFAGRTIILETGRIARQADGAVMATMGGTSVLCTAVAAKKVKEGQDFFPLTVHYQHKFYATGRIPGGFFKRETRPSEHETLTSRLIDRPIRPLFPDDFLNEVQIICTTMSHDMENSPDILALIGASAALTLSGVPFMGPIAGTRVGYKNGEYILNPTIQQMEDSELDLIVAGTKEGVLMVESEAKELSEEVMLGAVQFGWKDFQPVIDGIISLAETAAKDPWDLAEENLAHKELYEKIKHGFSASMGEAYGERIKQTRQEKVKAVKENACSTLVDDATGVTKGLVSELCHKLEADVVRSSILKTGKRIDGRSTVDIRPIKCEVGILPRVHGSALFTRGETQAIVITTLGTGQDEQIIDALEGEYRERFMLNYNFPPYSVGETGRMGAPGRREIGHGKLAWRALRPMIPNGEDFPYTMRVVSEITESNGSSSMASVCGGSLSMMDAGVPLTKPVAGIAMGLIKEGNDFAVLSDILGDEDHLGDMDFKVAGTTDGVTALQMDLKIASVTEEIMKIALAQAQAGRLHILNEMSNALTGARDEISQFAPQMAVITIPTEKIREVIGTGGKVIREIVEKSGAKVDIDDSGTIKISAVDGAAIDTAIEMIKGITDEPEQGKVYNGKVVKIVDFGAFVNFMGGKDGLVHISELADQRVAKTGDVVSEGQMVKVLMLGSDDRGKVKLSMKRVNQETGEVLEPKAKSRDNDNEREAG